MPHDQPFPKRVGRYEIIVPIAAGGMATVYRGRATGAAGFSRDVAIKLLHPHLRHEEGAHMDPLEEARVAGRIRHPNVVGVLDIGESPWGLYLVMEYVEGPTLSQLLRISGPRPVPMPSRVALRVLCDLLSGLHAAHELCDEAGERVGLVHRDVSPQNILVGTDGIGRLTDFGIAKVASRDGATRTGLIKGKAGYMAPEQLRGKGLDARCDVWAAGVIAWEMLVGRRLFSAPDPLACALKILDDPILEPSVERASVPAKIGEIVMRALRRPLHERLPSAEVFREALRASGEPIADASEVAAYVEAEWGAEIRKFRERVKSALARPSGPTPLDDASAPPVIRPEPDATMELATVAHERSDAALAASPPARSWSSNPAMWIVGGCSVAAAGLILLAVGERTSAAPPSSGAPDAEPAKVASPADSSSDPPPPTTTPAPIAERPPSARIQAEVPIASIRIGNRLVTLAVPTQDITLELLEHEWSPSTRLTLVARDGRQVSLSIADAEAHPVRFPPAVAPRPKAPAQEPLLMDTPYKNP